MVQQVKDWCYENKLSSAIIILVIPFFYFSYFSYVVWLKWLFADIILLIVLIKIILWFTEEIAHGEKIYKQFVRGEDEFTKNSVKESDYFSLKKRSLFRIMTYILSGLLLSFLAGVGALFLLMFFEINKVSFFLAVGSLLIGVILLIISFGGIFLSSYYLRQWPIIYLYIIMYSDEKNVEVHFENLLSSMSKFRFYSWRNKDLKYLYFLSSFIQAYSPVPESKVFWFKELKKNSLIFQRREFNKIPLLINDIYSSLPKKRASIQDSFLHHHHESKSSELFNILCTLSRMTVLSKILGLIETYSIAWRLLSPFIVLSIILFTVIFFGGERASELLELILKLK